MIRVLIVDDQNFVCEILQTSLESQPDLQVVGRANNGEIAIEQIEILDPDIVLMDINMPVMDGLTATQKIVRNFPQTNVIIFSNSDEDFLRQNAINAGAKSYFSKTAKTNEIIAQIRLIYQKYSDILPELKLGRIVSQTAEVSEEFILIKILLKKYKNIA